MRFLMLLLPLLTFAQGKIEIHGRTNVSKFKCINEKPIIKHSQENASESNVPGEIYLFVKDFECNNKRMTEDFREMMHIHNHPVVKISNQLYKKIKPKTYQSNSIVQMNGAKKEYNIALRQINQGWHLRKQINLQDFNLEPPKVLGGLVYVKDNVMIDILIEN